MPFSKVGKPCCVLSLQALRLKQELQFTGLLAQNPRR
jgi:hypothetical protein